MARGIPRSVSTPLISVAELTKLDRSNAVIFDCRFDVAKPGWGRAQYEAGHIAGAFFADIDTDLASPVTPTTGRHPLPDATTFAQWLGAHGITEETSVIVYDQAPGAFAARLWWLLRAAGHADVRVLDGGLAAWTAAGQPVTTDHPVAKPLETPPTHHFAGWITTDDVARGLNDDRLVVVDARAADRYAGQNETIDPVAGHIAGALSRPFMQNLRDGRFLPPDELRAQWKSLLGDRSSRELVVSCGSGVTACHHLLALEHAGLDGARLYAGSFSEWIRDPERPVVTGDKPR